SSGTARISDTEWRGEFLAKKKNGDPFWEYATISPIRNAQGVITNFIGIHEDVTERRKLEDQLRHSQKLEALGQLVGGIAHDFNNMLTAIIGFAGILEMKMKKDDPLIVNVEQVIEAAKRGASLTSSLLVFGRKQAIFPRPLNLNEIIEKVEKLLLRLIGEDIELKTVILDKELNVTADPLQIEQVLINLATNARDAMSKEGVLTIETSREEIDRKFINSHGYGEIGEYALISVSDTGAGMDEKIREKVFEPFFTTKEVGKGTGLGLAIVYGIVKQHNGYITVYSELGKGTTFKIYLPMTKPVTRDAAPVETAASTASATGTETVLVAEDDKSVMKLSKTLLETFGYTVIEAVNGEEAVQKYMENKDMIKLLILDVIMPKKNGKDAYEEIKKITPEARAIFMSGYTADIMHTKGIIENGMVFISKPISPTDFIKKVREVLDR
ncbi:MAG: sensor histidine kinase response regulator, PAS, PAS and PAS, partial [Deltaproteobacteria bacterium]|nr:sensor histidine kinase response regulator, PAS, PAS and PAS [Deltaproteobacteria bacterium]